MSGSRSIQLILHLLPVLFFVGLQSLSAAPIFVLLVCYNNGIASNNFSSNLARLFNTQLYDEGGRSLYNATDYGEYPDKVYGLYLCRFDVPYNTCQTCIAAAVNRTKQTCNGTKEAFIWYDECQVGFSNRAFASSLLTSPNHCMRNVVNVTAPGKFSELLNRTFNETIALATSNGYNYASASVNVSTVSKLYSLVQCIPDLSAQDCGACLANAFSSLPNCSGGQEGGRILSISCNIRYELYPFYGDPIVPVNGTDASGLLVPDDASPPDIAPGIPPADNTAGSSEGGKGRQATWIAIGTTLPVIVILVLSGCFLPRMWRRYKEEKARRRTRKLLRSGDEHNNLGEKHQMESEELPIFPLGQILEATQHFSDENKLGEGGFGPVYKGVFADGKEIAVKRLSRTSGQGLQEFKNEIILIAKLQHKNLVRLLGCCLEEKEFLLVYEYMPNKSLNVHVFDSTRGTQLDWKQRTSIINGIARGLLYLHKDSQLKIIHRDLKTGNILLDHNMNPKISDFGMARIFGGNQNEAKTERVVGTYGYMAPEYAMQGIFSIKSDVFSFGILVLEIISGRKNTSFHLSEQGQSLLTHAWKLWCEGHALELMDPALVQSYIPNEFLKLIHIGLLCIQKDPIDRPTMSSVVVMLVSDDITLPKPTQPAFSVGRPIAKSDLSSSTSKACSVNEVTLSDVIPR